MQPAFVLSMLRHFLASAMCCQFFGVTSGCIFLGLATGRFFLVLLSRRGEGSDDERQEHQRDEGSDECCHFFSL